MASGGHDWTIKLWNVENDFEFIHKLEGHTKVVNSVKFTSDSKFLVSASGDYTIILWDVESYERLDFPLGHSKFIYIIDIS